MATYTLETPRGKRLTIEAKSDADAMELADRWDLEDHAASEAQRIGVRPDLILSQMNRESRAKANAVSPKGARGPMQLMPGTAKELGVDPDDPYANITGGVTYMKQQLDRYKGDERLALAAYNAGPGAVDRAGGVPNYPETQAYVGALAGRGRGAPAVAPGLPPPAKPMPAPKALRPDDVLGFASELARIGDRSATGLEWMASKVGLDKPINALGEALGLPTTKEAAASHKAFVDKRAAEGVRPGNLGKFTGDVVGTLALARLPGGPLTQGAAGGVLTGDSTDAEGVAKDATIGAVTGRLAAAGSDAVQLAARKLLSKSVAAMSVPELKAAEKAAWTAVDNAGIMVPTSEAKALVGNIDAFLAKKGWAGVKIPEIDRLRSLSKQNGGVMLSQLNDLYSDAYTALVKPGGRESVIGSKLREEINAAIGKTSQGSDLVRTARDLTSRFKKADYVNRMSLSADRAAERTYGGDYGRKLKDRLNPLVDEAMPQRNMRGATPDEAAAIDRLVRGTKLQNLSSTVGGMLDPRRLGGKIVTGGLGTGGLMTGGATLPVIAAQMAAGFGLTGASSKIARNNLDDLLKLIAVGGKKADLKPTPTALSYGAEKLIAKARPYLVAAGVAGAAPATAKTPQKKRPAK